MSTACVHRLSRLSISMKARRAVGGLHGRGLRAQERAGLAEVAVRMDVDGLTACVMLMAASAPACWRVPTVAARSRNDTGAVAVPA
jgi:hypothetical protein